MEVYLKRIASLEEEVEGLRQKVKRYEKVLFPETDYRIPTTHLSPQVQKLFNYLVNHAILSPAAFQSICSHPDANPFDIIRSLIYKLRGYLHPHNVDIKVEYGRGYYIPGHQRDWIKINWTHVCFTNSGPSLLSASPEMQSEDAKGSIGDSDENPDHTS